MTKVPDGTIMSISVNRTITFYNISGDKVGELDFNGSKVLFEGVMSDSADSFFKMLQNAINPFFKDTVEISGGFVGPEINREEGEKILESMKQEKKDG